MRSPSTSARLAVVLIASIATSCAAVGPDPYPVRSQAPSDLSFGSAPSPRDPEDVLEEIAETSLNICLLINSTDFWPPPKAGINAGLAQLAELVDALNVAEPSGGDSRFSPEEVAALAGALSNEWRAVVAVERTDPDRAMARVHGPLEVACHRLLDFVAST